MHGTKKWITAGGLLFLFLWILPVNAAVRFSEIMYDLPNESGSDSGREWVEIVNLGESEVSLAGWRFFEAETNHKLTSISGGEILPARSYAIIADSAQKFMADWPGFNGLLFDSSFSLSNTGEKLILRNSDLADLDTVNYTSEWGASGDGHSLQRDGDKWLSSSPNPGAGQASAPETATSTDQTNESETDNTASSPSTESAENEDKEEDTKNGTTPEKPAPKFKITIDSAPERAIVGAHDFFTASVSGLKGEPIGNARFVWNFGDGTLIEGEEVLHAYHYPGRYVVFVTAASGEQSVSGRIDLVAEEAQIEVSGVSLGSDGFIELTNHGARELELSHWFLRLGDKHFMLPPGTIILPRVSVRFPATATGLRIAEVASSTPTGLLAEVSNSGALLYPNGVVAAASHISFPVNPQTFAVSAPAPTRTVSLPTIMSGPTEVLSPAALGIDLSLDKNLIPQNSEVASEVKVEASGESFSDEEAASALSASVAQSLPEKNSWWVSWVVGVSALSLIGAVAVFTNGHRKAQVAAINEPDITIDRVRADDFTITE